MKGIWFYEEFGTPHNKRKRIASGNCIALYCEPNTPGDENARHWYPHIWNDGMGTAIVACAGALLFEPNSVVCSGNASVEYIHKCCKRVSEAHAREVHPKLFEYLEDV